MHVTLCPEHAYYAPSPQMYKAACWHWILCDVNIMSTHTDIARILYLLRNSDCGLMMKSSLSKLQRRSFFLSWKDVKPACLSLNHFRDDFFFPSSFIEITAAHCIKSPHFFALIVFMSAVCTCVPICSMLPSFMSDINLLNATLQSIWAWRQKQFHSKFVKRQDILLRLLSL